MKITTKYIKNQISIWHTSTELRNRIDGYYSTIYGPKYLIEVAENFNLKQDATSKEIYDKMYDLLRDGNQWARESKNRNIDSEEDFLQPTDFVIGLIGKIDIEKINNIYKLGLHKKIVLRKFTPKIEPLTEDFCLEVFSDPEDKEIICHDLIIA